ncbi:MAG: PxKF domain-containing protein [Chloroflexota bacterium]
MRRSFRWARILLVLAIVFSLAMPLVAYADSVRNDVTAGGNTTITAGGSTTVEYYIQATSNDGQQGCNAADGTSATVTINAPAGVNVSQNSLVFSACGNDAKQSVVFSSTTAGDYGIGAGVSDQATSGGTYDTTHASFTLHVLPATAPSDTTPPVITPNVDGTLGNNGWYVSDVTVSWDVSDGESDITSKVGCETTTIDYDTPGVTLTCEATSAGGTNSESVTIKRDATAPVVSVTGVTDGETYTLGSVPTAGCSTTDALSGVYTEASLDITGGNTNGVGEFTATCSGALDNAGNSGNASVTYSVIYDWDGFFRPIENDALNKVKAGSAVPIKFSLNGDQGLGIFEGGYPKVALNVCGNSSDTNDVADTVNAGGSSLTYDASADQYIYVWKTDKAWAGQCGILEVKLNDGTSHTASFQFMK